MNSGERQVLEMMQDMTNEEAKELFQQAYDIASPIAGENIIMDIPGKLIPEYLHYRKVLDEAAEQVRKTDMLVRQASALKTLLFTRVESLPEVEEYISKQNEMGPIGIQKITESGEPRIVITAEEKLRSPQGRAKIIKKHLSSLLHNR